MHKEPKSLNHAVIHTGGLYIELSFRNWRNQKNIGKRLVPCENGIAIQNSTLTLSACEFIENKLDGRARGGGLSVFVSTGSSGNRINVENCCFCNNSAPLGGGAYFILENVLENIVMVTETSFISNQGTQSGGGINIGYIFIEDYLPVNNKITFIRCHFISNEGRTAGGMNICDWKFHSIYRLLVDE